MKIRVQDADTVHQIRDGVEWISCYINNRKRVDRSSSSSIDGKCGKCGKGSPRILAASTASAEMLESGFVANFAVVSITASPNWQRRRRRVFACATRHKAFNTVRRGSEN